MLPLTLSQLRMLDALVEEGSLQAAAARLGRTHPTLHVGLKAMEQSVGFTIFDRSSYRLQLTERGAAFLVRARRVLAELDGLEAFADQAAAGEETVLRIVVGDLTPLPAALSLLRDFFARSPHTELHLRFEALSAPWRLLLAGEVDLILHHLPAGDLNFEALPLGRVDLIPVAAPDFLPDHALPASAETLRTYTQCVIRDSSAQDTGPDYYLLKGAHTCSVGDQMMKREVIVQGLAWGHMPDYLVAEDIAKGRLISLKSDHLRGGEVALVAARRAGSPHGPVASRLWTAISSRATSPSSSDPARVA